MLAFLPIAFWLDLVTFRSWTICALTNGIWDFYGKITCDYPPAAIYIMWLWGKLYQWFIDPSLHNINTVRFVIWFKVLPILMDVVCSLTIFTIVKKMFDPKSARKAALLYAFNPAVIFVSSVWGQLDSLLICGLIVSSYFLLCRKYIQFCLVTALTILIKPQGIFLIPLFLIVCCHKPNLRTVSQLFTGALCSLVLAWAIILPMVPNKVWDLTILLQPYSFFYTKMHTTGASMSFSTVSAFNFWTFSGAWLPDNRQFLGAPHWLIGIVLLVALSLGLWFRFKRQTETINPAQFYLSAAITFLGIFLFATRMHERYMLPALAFLAITSGFCRKTTVIYLIYSVTALLNILVSFAPFYPPMEGASDLVDWASPLLVLVNLGLFFAVITRLWQTTRNTDLKSELT
jgi:Gpi18-like mannosyltransferase